MLIRKDLSASAGSCPHPQGFIHIRGQSYIHVLEATTAIFIMK
jgi:hypothetical protein